jgi:hypothetical protein
VCSGFGWGIGVYTPGVGFSDLVKSDFINNASDSRSGRDYQYGGSWIGFVRTNIRFQPGQPWVRSPAGVETQCSTLATGTAINAVSPNGEIMFNGAIASAASPMPKPIFSAQGKVVHRDNDFYIILGDTLFVVRPSPGPDGGTPDGGTPDARPLDASSAVDAFDDRTSVDAPIIDGGSSLDIGTGGAGGSGGSGGGAATAGTSGAGGTALPAVDASFDSANRPNEPPPESDGGCTIGSAHRKRSSPVLITVGLLLLGSTRWRRSKHPLQRRL